MISCQHQNIKLIIRFVLKDNHLITAKRFQFPLCMAWTVTMHKRQTKPEDVFEVITCWAVLFNCHKLNGGTFKVVYAGRCYCKQVQINTIKMEDYRIKEGIKISVSILPVTQINCFSIQRNHFNFLHFNTWTCREIDCTEVKVYHLSITIYIYSDKKSNQKPQFYFSNQDNFNLPVN